MELTNLTGLIFSIATLIAALGSVALAGVCILRINKIYHATNSMKDELISEVRSSEHARGVKEGLELAKR